MSAQPIAGHGRLCSMSHMPEKSGLPSAVRGAGALRFGFPFANRGTPAVGYFSHWADSVTDDATTMVMTTPVAVCIVTLQPRNALFY